MNEEKIIENLKTKGYQKVYIWDAEPGEMDGEHWHDFDTHLTVLEGKIQIISLSDGVITNRSYQHGDTIFIKRDTPHSAQVGTDGCRYIVAEKH